MKILIILAGLPRGGEDTWNSIYSNLQEPLNADLAIATSKKNVINTSLYKKSKHKFFFDEYDNWYDYYKENFNGNWKEYFSKGQDTGLETSGYIHFAIKDIIKRHYIDIVKEYDQIVYTRFDQYFIFQQHHLDNASIWISEGEDYKGVNDRIAFFSSEHAEEILSICDYIDSPKGLKEIPEFPNCESVYLQHLKYINLAHIVKRYERNHFTSALISDPTNWRVPVYKVYFYKNLMFKYPNEFITAMKNKLQSKGLIISLLSFRLFVNYCYLYARIILSRIIKS